MLKLAVTLHNVGKRMSSCETSRATKIISDDEADDMKTVVGLSVF